jgi:predicted DNA binding CopG/RHH family protein
MASKPVTTMRLSQDFRRQIKIEAVKRGMTIDEFLNLAVKQLLAKSPA